MLPNGFGSEAWTGTHFTTASCGVGLFPVSPSDVTALASVVGDIISRLCANDFFEMPPVNPGDFFDDFPKHRSLYRDVRPEHQEGVTLET